MQLDSTGRSVGIAVSSGGEEVNWANAKAKAAKLARSPAAFRFTVSVEDRIAELFFGAAD